jgi:condensin complex subunit 3
VSNNRLIYGSVLLAHTNLPDDAMPGAAHPRALTIAQREQVLCNGLGDHEPAVRAAAGKLIGAWVDAVSVGTKLLSRIFLFFSVHLISVRVR